MQFILHYLSTSRDTLFQYVSQQVIVCSSQQCDTGGAAGGRFCKVVISLGNTEHATTSSPENASSVRTRTLLLEREAARKVLSMSNILQTYVAK